jgi:hypothetical protein
MKKYLRYLPVVVMIAAAFIAGSWITWSLSGRGQPQGGR